MNAENIGNSQEVDNSKETKSFANYVFNEPKFVQEACLSSLSDLISKIYEENINPDIEIERWTDFKIKSVESLMEKIENFKSSLAISSDYDEKEFIKKYYVWILLADKREIVEQNVKIMKSKKLEIQKVVSWLPSRYELRKIAMEIHDKGELTIRAFFSGNKLTKLFDDREVEKINKFLTVLDNARD